MRKRDRLKQFLPPILLAKIQHTRAAHSFMRYKKLVANNVSLKDKHKGQRCFILGSGSSIKKENLKPLKNEVVFALNNFYVHEDFAEIMSGSKDKYYLTAPIHKPQTEEEWKTWLVDMEKNIPNTATMIFGINNYQHNIKYILDKYNLFKKHKINWYYASVNVAEHYQFNKKDIDITNMVWQAGTASVYALINAIYMGFDEIYLVGMDHNYLCNSEKCSRFYKPGLHQKDERKRSLQGASYNRCTSIAMGKIFTQYDIFLHNTSANIYNLSKDSWVDMFEFRTLNDVL